MFQEELRDYLLANFPDAKVVSGGKEVNMRCRFCGDSQKDPRKKRLYISLGYDKPPQYNCFNCGESGYLTPEVLRDLGLYDYDIAEKLVEYNRNMRSKNPSIYRDRDVYTVNNTFVRDDPVSYKKLEYLNNRLGTNLTFRQALDLKIIINLKDLLACNYLRSSESPQFTTELDEHFIGFLSEDNNFIMFRNVDSTLGMRHYKYNLHGKVDSSKRYYIPHVYLDLINPQPVDICIAEGPFDILGIMHNTMLPSDRILPMAIGGKAYINAIKHVIGHLGIINARIHLYVDADVSTDSIKYGLIKSLMPFDLDIFIHRNLYPGEKDFGVSPERINEGVQQIWVRSPDKCI